MIGSYKDIETFRHESLDHGCKESLFRPCFDLRQHTLCADLNTMNNLINLIDCARKSAKAIIQNGIDLSNVVHFSAQGHEADFI